MSATTETPSTETINGWHNIRFLHFGPRPLERVAANWNHLTVWDNAPAVEIISDAIIPWGAHPGDRLVAGVYKADRQLVDASVPHRGAASATLHRLIAPSEKMFLNAVRDRRSAYYLGLVNVHYGHFVLETLSRAWAWRECGEGRVPIAQMRPAEAPAFVRALYELIPGLKGRIEYTRTSRQFESVLVPSPSFVIDREGYIAFKDLCRRMADCALGSRTHQTEQPVYLSRARLSGRRRAILGEDRLEVLLLREGFRVVQPETLSIGEQIALFDAHRWIVAPIGSACHTRIFSRRPNSLLMLTSEELKGNHLLCDLLCEGIAYYANTLFAPGVPTRMRLPLSFEPLMLSEEKALNVLKDLGLVRPCATFDGPPPGIEDYKRCWVEAAEAHAIRTRNERFSAAAREVASAN